MLYFNVMCSNEMFVNFTRFSHFSFSFDIFFLGRFRFQVEFFLRHRFSLLTSPQADDNCWNLS